MVSSTVRYGEGVTRELGHDMVSLRVKNIALFTDSKMVNLAPVKTALDSLAKQSLNVVVYDKVRVEPTDERYTCFLSTYYTKVSQKDVATGKG